LPMETILVISQIVALLCLSAVCIYVIVVLMRVREVLKSIEKDFKELTTRAVPILENREFITSRVKGITENIDDQVNAVRESIGSIKQVALNVVELERKVQERIEGPILEGVAMVAALFKGIRTFTERIRS
jgi:uncharacterized protein YoxC